MANGAVAVGKAVSMSEEKWAEVDAKAEALGISRSALVKRAVNLYFEYEEKMAELMDDVVGGLAAPDKERVSVSEEQSVLAG